MRTLVFVHGRSQEHKDAAALKEEWVGSLRSSLEKLGLNFPLSDGQVRFPYYGQTLFDLVNGQPGQAAEVIVKGELGSSEEEEFTREVLSEVIVRVGVTDEQIRKVAGQDVMEKGPLNWKWVQAGLVALDRFVPGASSATIALATRDVYRYLRSAGVRDVIEEGVRKALPEGEECVVVSHSLGTVVAYNLLRGEGQQHSWRVPLLVTLGSPLGVTAIVRSLRPIEHPPSCRTGSTPTTTGMWSRSTPPRLRAIPGAAEDRELRRRAEHDAEQAWHHRLPRRLSGCTPHPPGDHCLNGLTGRQRVVGTPETRPLV